MNRKSIVLIAFVMVACTAALAATTPRSGNVQFPAASGGKLTLDLEAGGDVKIAGTGGSQILVSYSNECTPECEVVFDENSGGLEISTRFTSKGKSQNSNIQLEVQVPRSFDVALDSNGGALSIDGVDGSFTGETKGGKITLHEVAGRANLSTMGGEISLTDSKLDGSLSTMGGAVLFENVVGDVKGSSMGGNVRYKNVRRSGGDVASPSRKDGAGDDLTDLSPETVQISTMGGEIHVEKAPEGADVMTMGGEIEIRDAQRFVRAKTMGGDIKIDSVDGWVQATTMGGDMDVTVTGKGGDVTLTSMSGDVVLHVPSGFGMKLDLEIAYTRNSSQDYRIVSPGGGTPTVTPEWDHEKGSPRKYIRLSPSVNGGGHDVKIRTINGNITVREGA